LIQLAAVAIAVIEEFDKGNSVNEIETVCKPIQYLKDKQYDY